MSRYAVFLQQTRNSMTPLKSSKNMNHAQHSPIYERNGRPEMKITGGNWPKPPHCGAARQAALPAFAATWPRQPGARLSHRKASRTAKSACEGQGPAVWRSVATGQGGRPFLKGRAKRHDAPCTRPPQKNTLLRKTPMRIIVRLPAGLYMRDGTAARQARHSGEEDATSFSFQTIKGKPLHRSAITSRILP